MKKFLFCLCLTWRVWWFEADGSRRSGIVKGDVDNGTILVLKMDDGSKDYVAVHRVDQMKSIKVKP